jgi:integrase/recombinase XerD
LADRYENRLARVSEIRQARGHPEKRSPPHASSLLATHLYEAGIDLRTLQVLPGHEDLKDTLIYVQLSARHLNATASPLDSLALHDKPPDEK